MAKTDVIYLDRTMSKVLPRKKAEAYVRRTLDSRGRVIREEVGFLPEQKDK